MFTFPIGFMSSVDGGGNNFPDMSYSGNSLSTATQVSNLIGGMRAAKNGQHIYASSTSAIYQYDMTAWDLSTASYASKSLNTSLRDADCRGFCFNAAGTKVYAGARNSNEIIQYNLSTPWDLSTASNSGALSVSAQVTAPEDVFLGNADSTLFVLDGIVLYQYDLSTPGTVSSGTYSGNSTTLTGMASGPGFAVSDDGKFVYGLTSGDVITEFELTTSWVATGATATGNTLNVSAQSTSSRFVDIHNAAGKLYMGENALELIYEYST